MSRRSLLVKFLDFRRPLMDEEKMGVYLRVQIIPERFPAAGALEEIGNNAQDEVCAQIKSDRVSATAREDAVDVWMTICRYDRPRGVALLKQEENKANTSAGTHRLKLAVQMALKYCGSGPPEEAACRHAARPEPLNRGIADHGLIIDWSQRPESRATATPLC
jgi:hypothetical protein